MFSKLAQKNNFMGSKQWNVNCKNFKCEVKNITFTNTFSNFYKIQTSTFKTQPLLNKHILFNTLLKSSHGKFIMRRANCTQISEQKTTGAKCDENIQFITKTEENSQKKKEINVFVNYMICVAGIVICILFLESWNYIMSYQNFGRRTLGEIAVEIPPIVAFLNLSYCLVKITKVDIISTVEIANGVSVCLLLLFFVTLWCTTKNKREKFIERQIMKLEN